MSTKTKFAIGSVLVALLSVLSALFVPAAGTLFRVAAGFIVAVVGSLIAARVCTDRLDLFFTEFESVIGSVIDNTTDQRMMLFKQPPLNRLGRRFNDLLDSVEDRHNQLENERSKYESILDELTTGVVAVDTNHRVIYLNDQGRRLLDVSGFNEDEHPILSEITRDDTLLEALNGCLESGESVHSEGKRVSPDEELDLSIDASALLNEDGEVVGAVAAIHDVTELRRLRTVRQDFVANVSHELKTPITAIRGYIETLADNEDVDPDTQERFIRKIKDQVRRMSSMTEDLLTISKLESNEEALESRRMVIDDPLNEAVETIRPQAQNKDLDLTVSLPEVSSFVEGDPAALRQIATNLLENAVKYTPENGTVAVEVLEEGDEVILTVEDSGIGIEPRKQDRIFERFYRVDSGRARSQGGTGLGLAIVKHLALTMGGSIEVDSTPGQGSTFTVRLPTA